MATVPRPMAKPMATVATPMCPLLDSRECDRKKHTAYHAQHSESVMDVNQNISNMTDDKSKKTRPRHRKKNYK